MKLKLKLKLKFPCASFVKLLEKTTSIFSNFMNINTRFNTKVGVSINPIWTRHNRTFLFAVSSPNPSLSKMVKGNSVMAFLWGIYTSFDYCSIILKFWIWNTSTMQRTWTTSLEWTIFMFTYSKVLNLKYIWQMKAMIYLSGVDMLSLDSLLEKLPALLRWKSSSPSWL